MREWRKLPPTLCMPTTSPPEICTPTPPWGFIKFYNIPWVLRYPYVNIYISIVIFKLVTKLVWLLTVFLYFYRWVVLIVSIGRQIEGLIVGDRVWCVVFITRLMYYGFGLSYFGDVCPEVLMNLVWFRLSLCDVCLCISAFSSFIL